MKNKLEKMQKVTDVKTGEIFYIDRFMANEEIFTVVHELNGEKRTISKDEVRFGYYKLG